MEITLNIKENIPADKASKLTELGRMVEAGVIAEQDYRTAVRLYTLAARAGEPEAFYHMGRAYMEGIGVDQDVSKAKIYFKQGAGCGNVASIVAIGRIYNEEGSMQQAMYCFKLAAEADDIEAITEYALMLEQTGGDTEEIMNMHRKAAGLGNAAAAEALGRIYEDKTNPEYSMDIALFWYRQAVSLGNTAAEADIKRLELATEKDIDIQIEYDDDI